MRAQELCAVALPIGAPQEARECAGHRNEAGVPHRTKISCATRTCLILLLANARNRRGRALPPALHLWATSVALEPARPRARRRGGPRAAAPRGPRARTRCSPGCDRVDRLRAPDGESVKMSVKMASPATGQFHGAQPPVGLAIAVVAKGHVKGQPLQPGTGAGSLVGALPKHGSPKP